VSGDAFEARSETRVARLDLTRSGSEDPAQHRIGLPLGLIASLLKDSRGDIHVSLPVGGRLSDPHFEVREAIWDAVRAITVKTIALPVSWIGRLRFTHDSRIQDVEIDPVAFEAGTTTFTRQGAEQVERLSGFLRRSGGARLVLTPVVTVGDIDQLKREALRSAIRRMTAEERLSEEIAAARVYVQHFPGREPPGTVDAIVEALREDEPPPAADAERLASRRTDAVRAALKDAGIDPARLETNRDAGALETADGGHVELAMTDQVRPRRGLLAELLHRLAAAMVRLRSLRTSPAS
jgi:hypothetical protein